MNYNRCTKKALVGYWDQFKLVLLHYNSTAVLKLSIQLLTVILFLYVKTEILYHVLEEISHVLTYKLPHLKCSWLFSKLFELLSCVLLIILNVFIYTCSDPTTYWAGVYVSTFEPLIDYYNVCLNYCQIQFVKQK